MGDPHLAQDVVQSVFVLLARKARDLRPGTILSGWLFRTTCHVSAHARRAEYRRKSRETTACTMIHDSSSTDSDEILWQKLAPHLDLAVAALSEADRSAILLRFYEKAPMLKVAEKLGVSEEAAKKRVSRAVEKMRQFLARRGVKPGGAVLAAILAEKTVQAAPAALAGTVVKISVAAASASASRHAAAIGAPDSQRLALGNGQAGGGTGGFFPGIDYSSSPMRVVCSLVTPRRHPSPGMAPAARMLAR